MWMSCVKAPKGAKCFTRIKNILLKVELLADLSIATQQLKCRIHSAFLTRQKKFGTLCDYLHETGAASSSPSPNAAADTARS
jgi:hypothetical protein